MRILAILIATFFIMSQFGLSSNAADDKLTSSPTIKPDVIYRAVLKPDGTIDLLPTKPYATHLEKLKTGMKELKTNKTIYQQHALPDAFFSGQNVLIHEAAGGQVEGLYIFPKDKPLPPSVINSLEPGDNLKLARYSSQFFLQTEERVRKVIVQLLNKARLTACELDPRPVQFGATAELAAGIGVSGKFAFSAVWNTVDLCK